MARFTKLVVLFAFATAGLLGVVSQAAGATRYAEVGGNGPPSGATPCPIEDPCALEPAVEDPSVANGDEVIVLPGTYDLGAEQPLDQRQHHRAGTGSRGAPSDHRLRDRA